MLIETVLYRSPEKQPKNLKLINKLQRASQKIPKILSTLTYALASASDYIYIYIYIYFGLIIYAREFDYTIQKSTSTHITL